MEHVNQTRFNTFTKNSQIFVILECCGMSNIKFVLISIILMSENRAFKNPDFKILHGNLFNESLSTPAFSPRKAGQCLRSNNSCKCTNISELSRRIRILADYKDNFFVFLPDADYLS